DGHQEGQEQGGPPSFGGRSRSRRYGAPDRDPTRVSAGAQQAHAVVRRGGRSGQAGRKTEIRSEGHMSVLAVLEHNGQAWHRMSWETLAAAQQIAREL